MSVLRLLLVRSAAAVATLVVVSMLLFAAVEVLPGDAATAILGANATPERLEALRAELHLDDGVAQRYLRWAGDVLRGDLGNAATSDASVWATIATPLRNSLVLGGTAVLAMSAVSIGVGLASGRRPGSRADRFLSGVSSLAVSLPEFVLGTILITVFASWLGFLPAVSLLTAGDAPWRQPEILVLPVATMAIVAGSFGARLVRAMVADAAGAPHIDAARLAGLGEGRIVLHHLLPGVIGPTAQVIASMVPYAVGGTIVVERLFGYPGIGSSLTAQLAVRDVTVVEAIGLLLTVVVVAALTAADLLALWANPRRRRMAATARSERTASTA